MSSNSLTIRGKIMFPEGKPDKPLPNGSVLTVKFQDTSRCDAPAIELGKCVQILNQHLLGEDLCFVINDATRPGFPEATVRIPLYVKPIFGAIFVHNQVC